VITQHVTKQGTPKILKKCTFPITGKQVIERIYTDLAIIDVTKEGLFVKELGPNVTFDYVKERTESVLKQY